MTPFAALLARLDHWLAAHRQAYPARLRPGVSDAALDGFEARFGLTLPAEFRQLYRWRDGQATDCTASLQGKWMFEALGEVASTKEVVDPMIGSDFESPDWWRTEWVPFLSDGGGNTLCLDLGGFNGGGPGQVIEFLHEEPDRPVRFPDLITWLADLVCHAEVGTLEVL